MGSRMDPPVSPHCIHQAVPEVGQVASAVHAECPVLEAGNPCLATILLRCSAVIGSTQRALLLPLQGLGVDQVTRHTVVKELHEPLALKMLEDGQLYLTRVKQIREDF